MSTRSLVVFLVVALCFAFGLQDAAVAATTGKIAGRVIDGKGEPLPGANVVILGTPRGATADADGFYTILLVQPGIHELEASLIGYQKTVQQGVKIVVGYTTTVDFRLRETTLEAQEIVVTAARPAVEPDKTASKYYVTAEDIAMTPVVKDARSWAGLQPGVQADGRSVRQGNFSMDEMGDGFRNERLETSAGWYTTTPKPISLTYTVDGVRMVNNDGRGAIMFTGVNRASIQEISVVTGVPEAEYGNMDAGIINIVTKEGGRDYHGFTEYRFSMPGQRHFGFNAYDPIRHINKATGKSRVRLQDKAWLQEREDIGLDGLPGTADDKGRLVHIQPNDYTDVAGHRWEGSLSGPVGSRSSFHISAKTDRQPSLRPNPARRQRSDWQFTGKLAFDLTSNMNLKVGGVYGTRSNYRVTRDAALADGRAMYLPTGLSGAGVEVYNDWMGYAVLTHSLSPRTLYELRMSYSYSQEDSLDVPRESYQVVRDTDGWFTRTPQQVHDTRMREQRRYALKFDFSSQVTKGNFFKAGTEMTWFRTWVWQQINRGRTGFYRFQTLYDYYEAAQQQYGADGQMDIVPAVDIGGGSMQPTTVGDDPAWNGYRDHPMPAMQMSAYLQDKMEFEGMVVTAGLRMDRFFHSSRGRAEPFWSALPQNRMFVDAQMALAREGQNAYPSDPLSFPALDGRDMFQILPRFGVSHPITDRSAIHFSYGRFFVLPIFYSMYGQTWESAKGLKAQEDLNNDGRLSSYEYWGGVEMGKTKRGTMWVRPGKTTNYEVGMDWNFVSDYTASATAYYRRSEDYLQQNNTFPYDPVEKQTVRAHWYQNAYSGETRGMELAVTKRFSNYFSFRATYSWYREQNQFYGGTHWIRNFYPDKNFIASGAYQYKFDIDPQTGQRHWKPLTAAEIDAIGDHANKIAQKQIDGTRAVYVSDMFRSQRPNDELYLPYTKEPNVVATRQIVSGIRGPANKRDSPSDGSVTLLFATPPGFGPRTKNLNLLGDLNVNLVLRVEPGHFFEYNSPTPSPSSAGQLVKNALMFRNQTTFMTDFGLEKGFNFGGVRTVAFFEATNLFNGRRPVLIKRFSKYQDIPKYGLPYGSPTPVTIRDNNDVWDEWSSFKNRRREIYFGFRLQL